MLVLFVSQNNSLAKQQNNHTLTTLAPRWILPELYLIVTEITIQYNRQGMYYTGSCVASGFRK